MHTRNAVVMLVGVVMAGTAMAAEDNLMGLARAMFKPIPDNPPELAGNPSTPAKMELGKMLFFESRRR